MPEHPSEKLAALEAVHGLVAISEEIQEELTTLQKSFESGEPVAFSDVRDLLEITKAILAGQSQMIQKSVELHMKTDDMIEEIKAGIDARK